jgi:hypothetical protein
MGGAIAPVFLAVETRFKAAIRSSGGLHLRYDLPEVDGLHFAPRVNVPVLMLNGRYDYFRPKDSSQLPLFHFLGTPDKAKKHVVFEAGHGILPHKEEVRESLDWLDKYLGPVRRNGVTVRSAIDCLVAVVASERGCYLLARDRDLRRIVESGILPISLWPS